MEIPRHGQSTNFRVGMARPRCAMAQQWPVGTGICRARQQQGKLEEKQAELGHQQAKLTRQDALLAEKDFKIKALTHELAYYRRVRFGKASEALSGEQRLLFEEAVDAAASTAKRHRPRLCGPPGRWAGTSSVARHRCRRWPRPIPARYAGPRAYGPGIQAPGTRPGPGPGRRR
jgi:hypothetical protein